MWGNRRLPGPMMPCPASSCQGPPRPQESPNGVPILVGFRLHLASGQPPWGVSPEAPTQSPCGQAGSPGGRRHGDSRVSVPATGPPWGADPRDGGSLAKDLLAESPFIDRILTYEA